MTTLEKLKENIKNCKNCPGTSYSKSCDNEGNTIIKERECYCKEQLERYMNDEPEY